MDPKSDSALPVIEAEAEAPKRPATLGRLAIARVTPEELAARRKAADDEETRKREARAARGAAAVTAPGAPPAPSAPTAENEMPMPEITAEVLSPYVAAQGPVLLQLMEAAVTLLGADGKHVPALCTLASDLARKLGAAPAAIDLIPCAVQALYVASQLDRRGPYAPPELATLQKLLGPTWAELGPLIEPCAKGGLVKAKFDRKETSAIAAAVCFFNHTRHPAPPAGTIKVALATLRGQRRLPPDALDALASALAG